MTRKTYQHTDPRVDQEFRNMALAMDKMRRDLDRRVSSKIGTGAVGQVLIITVPGEPAEPGDIEEFTSVPFITNVTGGNLIKTYVAGTSPSNKVLAEVEGDSANITVTVEIDAGPGQWQPTAQVNGVAVTLTRIGSETRRFSGSVAITMAGSGSITVVTHDGASHSIPYTLTAGPAITAAVFGAYPGSQTAVKAGDTIHITGSVATNATSIVVKSGGATSVQQAFPGDYSSGTFDVAITVGSGSGTGKTATLYALAGVLQGADFVTTNTIELDQVYPTIPAKSTIEAAIDYPGTQEALKNTEAATVTAVVTNFDSIVYDNNGALADFAITAPTTYAASKTWTRIGGTTGYIHEGSTPHNCRIVATRNKNAAVTSRTFNINVSHDTSLGQIQLPATRLRGSPTGVDHLITLIADQILHSTPNINVVAPVGTWQGSWVDSGSGNVFTRLLRITDADIVTGGQGPNNYSFTVSYTQRSGITGGAGGGPYNYSVGGFVERQVVYPAFDREEAIGAYVIDTAKLVCKDNAMLPLTYQAVLTDGDHKYTITDPASTPNANGNLLNWCDDLAVGANGTGTAYLTIEETV